MYYYKARMYSPTLDRFMQTDPIGYADGMNLYAYVGNDPVNKVDPNGTQAQSNCSRTNCDQGPPPLEGAIVVTGTRNDRWEDAFAAARLGSILFYQPSAPTGVAQQSGQSLERNGPKPPSDDENDPDYNRDLNKCRALVDPAARARCYESAERRKQARDNGVPEIVLPPLITWRIQPLPIPSRRCLRLRHPLAILGCEVITN